MKMKTLLKMLRRSNKDKSRLTPREIRRLRVEPEFIDMVQTSNAIDRFSEKLYTTYTSIEYLLKNRIPGDYVECGVYKGRHISMIVMTLLKRGVTDRDIYLYDTFAGMTKPGPHDVRTSRVNKGSNPVEEWETLNTEDGYLIRYAGLDEVKNYVFETGYPKEHFHFVQDDIKETVPNNRHKKIALLRLDTDWYELTKHELVHMYDLVSLGGVLIIDDYGSHEGARKAVDEFFAGQGLFPFLFRTNKNERAMVKTA